MNDTMTTKDAAGVLGVHPVTLRKWRCNSEFTVVKGKAALEDCQGLQFYYEHPRKIVYLSESVLRLKKILSRRKGTSK